MMKKICAMVLTLAMTLSLTAPAALAADAAVWSIDGSMNEDYTTVFKMGKGAQSDGAVTQEDGYINMKTSRAMDQNYLYVMPMTMPTLSGQGVVVVEATIRLPGASEGGRANEFAVRHLGAKREFPLFLKYGTEEEGGCVTYFSSFDDAEKRYSLDTTKWHNYGLVIDPSKVDESSKPYYAIYVDGNKVLETYSGWGSTAGDLVRIGNTSKYTCNMDVESMRVGTGEELVSLLGQHTLPADTETPGPDDPQVSWDLLDKALANYTENFKLSQKGTGTVAQKGGYIRVEKTNTADREEYTWVVPKTTLTLPKNGPFTVEATIRLPQSVEGTRSNEFSVRVHDGSRYLYPLFIKRGSTDGAVTNQNDWSGAAAKDTTSWHNYGMVIDPVSKTYDLYLDGELVQEDAVAEGMTGTASGDLLRLGADNQSRAVMDVESVRIGTGDCSSLLGEHALPADEEPELLEMTLSDDNQTTAESKTITVTVKSKNISDGTAVTAKLLDKDGGEVSGVTASATFIGNAATLSLTIPEGLDMGIYSVAVESGDQTLKEEYTVKSDLKAPTFPTFSAIGYTIELPDYKYNPTQEFNFPVIVDTKDHPVTNALTEAEGQDFRYYLFYAPHDAPAGNCMAASNSLDGPWVEYESNPLVGKEWEGAYKVSHVSSPYVMWLEEKNCYIMYFHGENPVTRYALSDDLINWTYGDICVEAKQFSPDGTGFNEASYAKVYQHEVDGLGNKYIMVLMVTGPRNNTHRNIYWAHSKDGITWTPVKESLLNPDINSIYKSNFSGPCFTSQTIDGVERYFVLCHASSGEMYAFEVGKNLDQCIEWGEIYNSQGVRNVDDKGDGNPLTYPDYGRSGAPFFIQDDTGRWHMYYEAGKRLHTNIVHAVEVKAGEDNKLARATLHLSDESSSLGVGGTVRPELQVFTKGYVYGEAGAEPVDNSTLTLRYHVSDDTVISYADGVITALAEGKATAWVEVSRGSEKTVSQKVEITVSAPAKEIILTNTETPEKTALNLELPAPFKAQGVLKDPIDNYYLYFSYNDEAGGSQSIALATAPAPEGPWTAYQDGKPVMTRDSLGLASGGVNAPWPIWVGDKLLMYYSNGSGSIGVAQSTDGVNFTNVKTVLSQSDLSFTGNTYQQSVYEYTVASKNNKYLMLYTGNGYKKGSVTNGKRLFYALSNDGLNWTAVETPLMEPSAPDSGDKGNVASPRLMVRDGEPYVVYHNSNGNIGYAKLSADFATVTPQGIFYKSLTGEPDRGRAADAALLEAEGHLYFYYTARSNKAGKAADASVLVCRDMGTVGGVFFEDDFADGDSSRWTVDSGTWTEADGVYTQNDTSGGFMVFAGDTSWKDYEFEVEVTPLAIQDSKLSVMISGRADGPKNRYIGSYNTGKLTINRRVNGGDTVLAEKGYNMELGTTYTMKLVFRGSQIELWVDGVKELEATDSTHTSGKIGLATYQTKAAFDNVVVRTPGKAEEDSTITLKSPASYQVIQRDPDTKQAVVSLNGTTQQAAATLEAKVVKASGGETVVDWTTLARDLASGGSWSGKLTVPQGGWYRLEIRTLDAAGKVVDTLNSTNKWGVGINILCIGQSNMVGQAPEKPRTVANDLVANYTRSGSWTHLVDPYDGAGGSMTPALGNALVEALGIPVGFVPAADSGSGLHAPNPYTKPPHAATRYWMYYTTAEDTSTLYGKAVTRAKAAGGVELAVWNQGETDGAISVPKETYESDMKTLLSRLRKDLGNEALPLFLCQIGTHNPNISTDDAYSAVRSAQRDLDDGKNFYLAATEMEFARKDTAHYRKDGMDTIGRRVANSILYSLGESKYYRGPSISRASWVDDEHTAIDVTISHRGGSDITPASDIVGFIVLDGEKKAEITSAVRRNATTIRLTLAVAVEGEAKVRYLYGLNPFVEEYDTTTTVSDMPQNVEIVKDNTPLALPLENTTEDIVVGAPRPDTPVPGDNVPNGPSGSVGTRHETLSDGTKVTTETNRRTGEVKVTAQAPNGTKTVTVTKADGSSTESLTRPDGVKAESAITAEGEVTTTVTIPSSVGWTSVELPAGVGNTAIQVGEDGEKVLALYTVENGRLHVALKDSAHIRTEQRQAGFTDLDGSVAEAAEALAIRDVFRGTGEGVFSPGMLLDRAMMATILYRIDGKPVVTSQAGYVDIAPESWYAESASWAKEAGMMVGVGGNRFDPDSHLLWIQSALVLYRYAQSIGAAESSELNEGTAALLWCAQQGIGTKLEPWAELSRGELAQVVYDYIRVLVDQCAWQK